MKRQWKVKERRCRTVSQSSSTGNVKAVYVRGKGHRFSQPAGRWGGERERALHRPCLAAVPRGRPVMKQAGMGPQRRDCD